MWMTSYVREVKRQLRDTYGFTPSETLGTSPDEDLVFENFTDGNYPMTIEGKLDNVKVINGRFSLCNFDG